MSAQSKAWPIENFRVLKGRYQVRDHTEDEIDRLTLLIIQEGIDQHKTPYPGAKHPHLLTKPMRGALAGRIFPNEPSQNDTIAIYDGTGRFRSLRDRIGVKHLVEGADFVIDQSVDSLEKLIKKSWEANTEKGYTWFAFMKEAKLLKDKTRWTQERIAEGLSLVRPVKQQTVSDWLKIADGFGDAIYDPVCGPVISEMGRETSLEFFKENAEGIRLWGVRQWAPLTAEQRERVGRCHMLPNPAIRDGGRGEDLAEFDVGWYFLDRWTRKTIPTTKTVHDCFTKILGGTPFPVAIGSLEGRLDRERRGKDLPRRKLNIQEQVAKYNEKAANSGGFETLRVVTESESRDRLTKLDAGISSVVDPNDRTQLSTERENLTHQMDVFLKFLKNKQYWGEDADAIIDKMRDSIEEAWRRVDKILGRLEADDSEKPEPKDGEVKVPGFISRQGLA